MAKVDAAQQQLATAQSNLAAANKARDDAQIQMNQFAAASYRGAGGLDRLSALMTSDSPGAFLTRASTLSALARHEQSVIALMTSTQDAQASAQDAANAALADQQVQLQAAAKAKDAAIAAVNAQAGQIAAINANQLDLGAQLAVLRGTAKDLATARAAGLKRQAEEAAAAAAAAKAAAARAAAARAAAAAAALAAQKRAAALAQQQAAAAAARQSSSGGGGDSSGSGGSGGGSSGYTNNGGGIVPPGGQSISTSAQRQTAIAFAESQIGVWYRWAGAGEVGPTVTSTGVQRVPGYDCSGLTMQAYAAAGISLAHFTGAQWDEGLHVSQAQLQPGDLVFFATNTNDPSTIHHVGIYIGNGQMVDAPATGEQIGIHNAFRPDYIGAVQL